MRRRSVIIWVLSGILVVVLLAAAIFGPPVMLRSDLGGRAAQLSTAETADAVNQIRTTIVQGFGAAVVLVGAYVGWRQLQHNITTARIQVELQRHGTVTDRYTRAVDQLAHTDQTIRVGAIHAVNRIAAEAPQERAGVVSLLAAFVRLHAPLVPDAAGATTMAAEADLPLRSKSPDVQAALTTLTKWIDIAVEPAEWLTADLSYTDLQNGNLRRCTLWHVRMRGANLAGANLSESDLRGTDLSEAVLDDADLSSARADQTTWWPIGFDPDEHGVTLNQ